jgi:multicomponent Na+:H+ antiporter subunit E
MTLNRTKLVYLLILTAFWLALTGSVSVLNLALGLAVSAASLLVLRGQLPEVDFRVRPWGAVKLALLVMAELFRSASRVARLVLSRDLRIAPDVVIVPVSLTRDAELTLLSNLITLTPGTLTIDVAEDRRALIVHALEAGDPDEVRRDIRSGFERAIREAFR